MGVEGADVDGFEVVQGPVGSVTGSGMSLGPKENGKLSHEDDANVAIKFGSHGDEPVKGIENGVPSTEFPSNATADWPAPRQIHSFFFVRYRPYDDPKTKVKIDAADREIQKANQARGQIIEELKAKRAEKAEVYDQLDALKSERKGFNTIFDEKRKEMEPLQHALGKLRDNGARGGGGGYSGLCSSEQELDDKIYSCQYRIQHESIPLSEEKQIIKEIKQLESTREKVIANAAVRAKIQDSLGQKEAIQDQVKSMGNDLSGVKKDRQAIAAKMNSLNEKLQATKNDIQALDEELKVLNQKRDKGYETIQDLRKRRDESNAGFYQSRTVFNKAREAAANKNIKELEKLSHDEVEKFMSMWNSDKAFRDDYEKRLLASLDARQMSRDGRIRNPDEKPLVAKEVPLPAETAPKASEKRVKEEANPAPQQDAPLPVKAPKQANNKVKEPKSSLVHSDTTEEDVAWLDYPKKEASHAEKEIDAAKLKEMRREEEVAKAKQAMERKKKKAEKDALKAAARAQKEAEKKLKDREKKAKKKAVPNSTSDAEESTVVAAEGSASDVEKTEVEAPAPAAAVREKGVRKERTLRYRKIRGIEAVPKAILKRRKANYWLWAAPAAVIALVLLGLAFYYTTR